MCFPSAALPKLFHVLQVPYPNPSPFILRQHCCLTSKHTKQNEKQKQSSTTSISFTFQVLFSPIFSISFLSKKKSILVLSRTSHFTCFLIPSLPFFLKVFHQFLSFPRPSNPSIKQASPHFRLVLEPPCGCPSFTTKS